MKLDLVNFQFSKEAVALFSLSQHPYHSLQWLCLTNRSLSPQAEAALHRISCARAGSWPSSMVYTCAWPRLRADGIQPPGLPSATASTASAVAAPSRRCPCRRPSGAGGAGAGVVTGRGGGGEMAACRPQRSGRGRG